MRHLMIVGDLFEDVECLATLDVLKRGGEEVVLASMMGRMDVVTKCGIRLDCDDVIENIDIDTFDSLIIPGGPGSFKILAFNQRVDELIDEFASKNKLVASICAAPMLVGRRGYFENRNYTVHPGFENQIKGGTYIRSEGVITDGNFICAKSMYYSIKFGLAIYSYYYGEEKTKKLKLSLQGE
ncbi:MAG: DJ-1/PfpI family protein [Bacilli bacterium]